MALGKSLNNILDSYFGTENSPINTSINNPTSNSILKDGGIVPDFIPNSGNKDVDNLELQRISQTVAQTQDTSNSKTELEPFQTKPNLTQVMVNKVDSLAKLKQQPKTSINSIPVASIKLNPNQTRTKIDQNKLRALSKDIGANGLLHPISVLEHFDQQLNQTSYLLLAGERRYRAVQMLGHTQILATVFRPEALNEAEQILLMAMENLQRENLSPLDTAKTYVLLMKTQSISFEELGSWLGKTAQHIRNYTKLLELAGPVQTALQQKHLTAGQARAFFVLSLDEQLELLPEVLSKNLSLEGIQKMIMAKNSQKLAQMVQEKLKKDKQNLTFTEKLYTKFETFAKKLPNAETKIEGNQDAGSITIKWKK